MNTVSIKINGVEYNLKGEEREEYLHKVALYVDNKLKNIMGNNSKLNLSSAAVLTAVNSVDDLFKCDLAYKDLCEEIEISEEKLKSQKHEIEDLKSQLRNSMSENKELKFQLQSSKYKIINVQNKLVENQVDLAKIKKSLNSPLKSR